MRTIVLVDDDFIIREVIKRYTKRYINYPFKFFSEDNGLEGLGAVFVLQPDLVILDTTLPKYSGMEVEKFLETNLALKAKNTPVILLHENHELPETYYNHVYKINKRSPEFIKNLMHALNLTFDIELKHENFYENLVDYFTTSTVRLSNFSNLVIKSAQSGNIFKTIFGIPLWFGTQILVSLYFTVFHFLIGKRVKDENIEIEDIDLQKFRSKFYPAFSFLLASFLIVFFQLSLFIFGGLTILNLRIESVLASGQSEANIDLTNSTYNSEEIEHDGVGGLQLKPHEKTIENEVENVEVPLEEAIPIQDQPLEVIPEEESQENSVLGVTTTTEYSLNKPSITFKQGTTYSKLISIKEQSNLNTEEASTSQVNYEMLNRILPSNVITYQLSPDGTNWFYYGGENKWEKTENGAESSNTIQEVNKFLQEYPESVGGSELFIKAFLISNGSTQVRLNRLIIEKQIETISEVQPIVEDEPIEQPTVEISISDTVSAPVSFPTEGSVEIEQNNLLPAPTIFTASFYQGKKIINGKILAEIDESDLSLFKVRAYYTNSTNIRLNALDKGEFIGESNLSLNFQGVPVFFINVDGQPGGYITAELILEQNASVSVSQLSRPIENSTFTVDSTADTADHTLNGTCSVGTATGGACTLRAAIAEANSVGGSDNIFFNIPTSDSGYRDYDTPSTPSSGDSVGGDDYWTITPATTFDTVTGTVTLDASTQTVNQTDTNTSGSEIELNGSSIPSGTNGGFRLGSVDGVVVNGFTINGFNLTGNSGVMIVTATNTLITNNYLGTDVKGLTAKPNFHGVLITGDSTGTVIGTSSADKNIISGNTLEGVRATCAGITCTVSIKGNWMGPNSTGTTLLATPTAGFAQISAINNVNIQIGGATVAERNVLATSASNGNAIFLQLAANTTSGARVYNNYIGTDPSGTVNLGHNRSITVNGHNATVGQQTVEIGGAGLGNLIRFGGGTRSINIESDRNIDIIGNTIGDNATEDIRINNVGGAGTNTIRVLNNSIGATSSDPHFGLAIGTTLGAGIINRYTSTIQGNIINNSARFGIYNGPQNLDSRTNISTDTAPRPTIGGTGSLSGSLCNGLQQNCISGNAWGGIFSIDTVPNNEGTIYTDNDFTGGNGPSNVRNVEQAWSGLFEIFSGTARRTDLTGTSLSFPNTVLVRTGDDPATNVTSSTAINVTCLNGSGAGCPASGHTSGTVDVSYIVVPSGQTAGVLSTIANWFKVTQYIINNAGVQTNYDSFKFDQNHFASSTFTYDGNSSNNVINTGSSRSLNSQTYTDRGEPWTDKPTATRNIATGDYGRFQIMEVELVDANPFFDGVNYTITVDSTSDENNVGSSGFDDGGGSYSGGGTNGSSGLANGLTSLREAMTVAQSHSGTDRIYFNIPTSDSGYRDYDTPDTPSSGDSSGGDDYWTIRPSATLPNITTSMTIDGSTQETNSGIDRNTDGPDIEVSGISMGTMPTVAGYTAQGIFHMANPGNGVLLSLNKLAINNAQRGQGVMLYTTTAGTTPSLTVTGSYIGVDVRGLVAQPNTHAGTGSTWLGNGIFAHPNTTLGNINIGGATLAERNIISGNQTHGVFIGNGNPSSITPTSLNIRNNYIGVNRTGTAAITNVFGVRLLYTELSSTTENLISGNTLGIFLDRSSNAAIEDNNIGLNATQTATLPNNVGIDWRNALTSPITNSGIVIDSNVISGNTYMGIRQLMRASSITNSTISNNIMGTNSAKDTSFPNTAANIFIGNWHYSSLPTNTQTALIEGNTLWNAIAGTVEEGGLTSFPIPAGHGVLINNLSESSAITIRNNDIRNNAYAGIELSGAGPSIVKGNNLVDNGRWGIVNRVASTGSQNSSRTNASDDVYARPIIGGTASLAGSLCNGLETNCISGNDWVGIYSHDTVPTNESTIYSDNNFTGGNGPSNAVNVEQAWSGLLELFSGTTRRTDLTNNTISLQFPNNTRVKTSDDPASLVTSGNNYTITCLTAGDCPASGHTSGVAGSSSFIAPSSATLSNKLTWYRFSEYVINGAGTKTDFDTFGLNQNHFVSTSFTFDGDSTNNVINTGSGRTINSENYTDRGEPWTNLPGATRNIATNSFGNFQIPEVDYVDANPVLNDEQIITVDSTTDEDNVSTAGLNDGSGAYSGGGTNGVSGLPNGLTSLKEALIVAKKNSDNIRIQFSSPTFTPSNAINLTSDNTSNEVIVDGSEVVFSGASQPALSNCIDINGAYNFMIVGFEFNNCKENSIKVTSGEGIRIAQNTYNSASTKAFINLAGGTEDGNDSTANDANDADTGANNLMNYPVIESVTYIGEGTYVIRGSIDNTQSGEDSVLDAEICETTGHSTNHGGCSSWITSVSSVDGEFEALAIYPGEDGTQNHIFTSLATNALGSTSEFGENFELEGNPNYFIESFSITTVAPIGNTTDTTPLFDWNASLDPDLLQYDLYLDGNKIATIPNNTTQYQYTGNALIGNHTWEVRGIRTNSSIGGTSGVQNFSVIPSTTLSLVYPANGNIIDNQTPLLKWTSSNNTDVNFYDIYIDNTFFKSVAAPTLEYQVTDAEKLSVGSHTWQVVAYIKGTSNTEVGRTNTATFEIKLVYKLSLNVSQALAVDGKFKIIFALSGNQPPTGSRFRLIINDSANSNVLTKDFPLTQSEYELNTQESALIKDGETYTIIIELVDANNNVLSITQQSIKYNKDISIGDVVSAPVVTQEQSNPVIVIAVILCTTLLIAGLILLFIILKQRREEANKTPSL